MNKIHMDLALECARYSLESGDVPVGAVIVREDAVVSTGYNEREKSGNISRHAEIIAIEKAANLLGTWKLEDCILYTTLEPCVMCYGAISQSRIRVVYIASEGNKDKDYVFSNYIDRPDNFHYGCRRGEAQKLLKDFFEMKRSK